MIIMNFRTRYTNVYSLNTVPSTIDLLDRHPMQSLWLQSGIVSIVVLGQNKDEISITNITPSLLRYLVIILLILVYFLKEKTLEKQVQYNRLL